MLKPNWPAPSNIVAYSTTRLGGFSHPPYDSFNLGLHTGDAEATVIQNRNHLAQQLQLPQPITWLNQVHSAVPYCLDEIDESIEPTADAAYTQKPNRVCIVLTADCLPILMAERHGHAVAAIHAGWRGLLAGIIDNTFSALKIPPDDTLVWLGPAIGPTAFEVGEEVRAAYLKRHPGYQSAFHPHRDRWLADLYQLAKITLNHLNITQINGGNFCTYREKERFFSYRRDGEKTGRMASLIWIKEA